MHTMAIPKNGYKKNDRRLKQVRVVPFTIYLDPAFDRKVREVARAKDLTLTQFANRALRLLLQLDKGTT